MVGLTSGWLHPAIPKAPSTFLGTELAFFQVHFNDTPQPQGFVLSPEELEDFSAGLDQLMEYVRIERETPPELRRRAAAA